MNLTCRCPEWAKIGHKMIYSSSKDTLKKRFAGVSLEFRADEYDDLDYETLAREVERKS